MIGRRDCKFCHGGRAPAGKGGTKRKRERERERDRKKKAEEHLHPQAPCITCTRQCTCLDARIASEVKSSPVAISNHQGAPKGRQQKEETRPGTHIFEDFCRFSLIFGSLCKSRDLGVADLRRKPQETADFRRKPQKTADFCRNRFLPFAVYLLARS